MVSFLNVWDRKEILFWEKKDNLMNFSIFDFVCSVNFYDDFKRISFLSTILILKSIPDNLYTEFFIAKL